MKPELLKIGKNKPEAASSNLASATKNTVAIEEIRWPLFDVSSMKKGKKGEKFSSGTIGKGPYSDPLFL